MKVDYDEATDTLTVLLRDAPVAESDEDKPGVILDYDDQGNLVSIEILDASTGLPILPRSPWWHERRRQPHAQKLALVLLQHPTRRGTFVSGLPGTAHLAALPQDGR